MAGQARAARRRLDPVLEPVIRAVEEGSVVTPAPAPARATPAPVTTSAPAVTKDQSVTKDEAEGSADPSDDDDPASRALISSLADPDLLEVVIRPFRGRTPVDERPPISQH
jgi:hypothetical protein